MFQSTVAYGKVIVCEPPPPLPNWAVLKLVHRNMILHVRTLTLIWLCKSVTTTLISVTSIVVLHYFVAIHP